MHYIGVLGSSTSVTVEAWMYMSPSTPCCDARLFDFGTSYTVNNVVVYYYPINGCLSFAQAQNGEWFMQDTSLKFISLGYVHVVLVMTTGGFARLYVNGNLALITSSACTIPTVDQQLFFYIGKSFSTLDAGLIGSVDEVRIWSGALSASQVQASYTAG